MKKFAVKFIIFLLPIITGFILTEYKLGMIPNSYSVKKGIIENKGKDAKILVLGNSHEYYGINPEAWPKYGINLANTSQSYYYDFKLLDKYLPHLASLKLVVIPISYFTLEYNLDSETWESWRQNYYLRYFGIPKRFDRIFDLVKYSFIALYSPKETQKFLLNGFSQDLVGNVNAFGTCRTNLIKINAISDLMGRERVLFHEKLMSEFHLSQSIKYIDNMIQILQNKNIKTVFLTTPVQPTYSKFLSAEKYNRMQNAVKQLSSKYNIPYYDFMTDRRFVSQDFFDNDHLNLFGADKFSKILYEEILSKMVSD